MKKMLILTVCLFIVSLCCCSCIDSKQTNSQTVNSGLKANQQTSSVEKVSQDNRDKSKTISEIITENYNLNEKEISFIKNIYNQREKYEVINDSNTQQFTRKDVEVYYLMLWYNGSQLVLVSEYKMNNNNNNEVYMYFKVDNAGNLRKDKSVIFDSRDTSNLGFDIGSGVFGQAYYTPEYNEEAKYNALSEMYIEYKKARQDKYADVQDIDEKVLDSLSTEKEALLNNIIKSQERWQYFDESRSFYNECRELRIWDFEDGTAEILCSYGTDVSIIHEKAFSVTSNGVQELDSIATERLKNDLKDTSPLKWTIHWSREKKKTELADYLI